MGQPSPAQGGPFFDITGIVFAPTAAGEGKSHLSEGGVTGIGLGFGQINVGGAGGAEGGWSTDDTVTAHPSDPNFSGFGATTGVAVDPANGAFAVGYDSAVTGTQQAFVIKLDAAKQTYAPVKGGRTDLGTLGGTTSLALGISKGAGLVVGSADDASGKTHAVFAHTGATAWTDLTASFPTTVLKSKAVVANDAGFIAGTATIKQQFSGRNTDVDSGFVYNVNTNSVTFFAVTGADIIPMAVLADGRVVGNLKFVLPLGSPAGSIPADHPFLFDGTGVTDFGTMTLASSHQPAYSCRVSQVNSTGEAAGSCTAAITSTFASAVASFYLNAAGGEPAFVDLNATVHARLDSLNTAIKTFTFTNASSIDDQKEIVLIAHKTKGKDAPASYLISKNAYQ